MNIDVVNHVMQQLNYSTSISPASAVSELTLLSVKLQTSCLPLCLTLFAPHSLTLIMFKK